MRAKQKNRFCLDISNRISLSFGKMAVGVFGAACHEPGDSWGWKMLEPITCYLVPKYAAAKLGVSGGSAAAGGVASASGKAVAGTLAAGAKGSAGMKGCVGHVQGGAPQGGAPAGCQDGGQWMAHGNAAAHGGGAVDGKAASDISNGAQNACTAGKGTAASSFSGNDFSWF